jgi:transposase
VFATRSKRALVYTFFKRKKQPQFVAHCKQVVARFNKVALFVDNGPCHKGKLVEEFLRHHRKSFRLLRFPTYSPELNPAESCWKPGRKDLANRALRTVAGVKYRLRKIFDDPKNMPKMFQYLSD